MCFVELGRIESPAIFHPLLVSVLMAERPPSMPDWRNSDPDPEPESLQPISFTHLQVAKSETADPQWELALAEFGQRHPRVTRKATIAWWMFGQLGLTIPALFLAINGWLPFWLFVVFLAVMIVTTQGLIIHYAGLGHQRRERKLRDNYSKKIERKDSEIKQLQDNKRVKLAVIFVDWDSGTPYPYRMDATGVMNLQKREGIEFQAIIRILNMGTIGTKVHNLSLTVEIEGQKYLSPHPEEKDGEQYAEFDLNGLLHYVTNHPDSIIPKLGRDVVEEGNPLEGFVRFRVPGMYAQGFPSTSEWGIRVTLGVEDDFGTRHFLPALIGPPPLRSKRLPMGIYKDHASR